MTRYNLLSPRKKKDGGTYWHSVGSAFPRDDGSFSLIFDSLPIPDAEGRVMVLMGEAKQRDNQQQRAPQKQQQEPSYGSHRGGYQGAPQDDDIPF